MKKLFLRVVAASAIACLSVYVSAGPLNDRIKEGKPIRIGYAIIKPFAFVNANGKPDGSVNIYSIEVLKKMGHTNIEGVAMDWGGLVPALQAGRIDIITGGMYITKVRCATVDFSDPMLYSPDVLMVPKGNPKGLQNYADIVAKGATFASISGYATIEQAKRHGVPAEKMMILPGGTQVVAAMRAGRADAFAASLTEVGGLLEMSEGALEHTSPDKMPPDTRNWISLAFRKNDADFVQAFNNAQKSYLGSAEMLKSLAPFGYTKDMIPKESAATVCNQ